LDRDANGAVDVPSGELPGAANVEKHRSLRDQVARLTSRDSYRRETHVEHGSNDDYQHD